MLVGSMSRSQTTWIELTGLLSTRLSPVMVLPAMGTKLVARCGPGTISGSVSWLKGAEKKVLPPGQKDVPSGWGAAKASPGDLLVAAGSSAVVPLAFWSIGLPVWNVSVGMAELTVIDQPVSVPGLAALESVSGSV